MCTYNAEFGKISYRNTHSIKQIVCSMHMQSLHEVDANLQSLHEVDANLQSLHEVDANLHEVDANAFQAFCHLKIQTAFAHRVIF